MVFVVLLTWGISGICSIMLLIKMKMVKCTLSLDRSNRTNLIRHFMNFCYRTQMIPWASSFCLFKYFGERLRSSFEEINDNCDQFAWHLFPWKTQQMLIHLIANAQNPVELRVFGSTSCTRVTLKKV